MAKKRQRLARLFYVGSKRGRVIHFSKHLTEGYRTLCGIRIPAPGKWFTPRSKLALARAGKAPKCKKCVAKAPQITVMRVRR